MYKITTPSGAEYSPPEGTCWKNVEEVFKKLVSEGRIWFGKDGKGMPRRKTYLFESDGQTAWTWWPNTEVGHTQESKKEIHTLFGKSEVFDTPKPERLIKRVVEIGSNPGDLILDSFAGSGTTGAVAHKMGRKWIMVELGEHCHTHIIPRMKKVCDGSDQGGVSKAVNWNGGGGFKYYYMAPSLLKKDRYDNWVINEEYNADMLASAMAKHESFTFSPDEIYYWKQGRSSEKDFIFTTTGHITPEHMDRIHEEMQPDESLLICCKSHFEGADSKYSNISVKKIPSMLLGRCEFGRDDYSLNIINMPADPDETKPESEPKNGNEPEIKFEFEFGADIPIPKSVPKKPVKKKPNANPGQLDLFGKVEE